MLWMFDRNFKTSKALKTFPSLLLMLSLFKVFLIFHQIKCTQWSEVVVYRVRSEKFREVLSSLFLFFPPLCAAYQNSIQNFTSFIRKEHLSSENRFKIPYFLCRLYQATLPQFWTSITLLQWKNKRELFHSKVIIFYNNFLPTFIVQFLHNLIHHEFPCMNTYTLTGVFKYICNYEKGQKWDLCRLNIGGGVLQF